MGKNPNDNENTLPYEQIDAGHMRAEAEKHGSTDPKQHRRHEAEIAALDHKEGKEKGGR